MTGARLRVLTFHRILPAHRGAIRPSVLSSAPDVFAAQMGHLARRYHVLAMDELLSLHRSGRALPDRAALVTFDDAYRDFGEIAWPILRRHGLPATLFVPTGFPDRPGREFWWDRLHRAVEGTRLRSLSGFPPGFLPLESSAARRASLRRMRRHLKEAPHHEAMDLVDALCTALAPDGGEAPQGSQVLGWDELRSLSRDGVTLAPHTRNHPALTRLPPEEAREEIRGSMDDLRREVGPVLPVLAYPFGDHDARVVDLAREEGFELAFTCREGHSRLPATDPLRLERTGITPRTTPVLFRARLFGWFSDLDRWRRRWATTGPAARGARARPRDDRGRSLSRVDR